MWTSKNRARYDRSKLRYPSDLTDNEWRAVEPLIPPGKRGGDKRTVVREVANRSCTCSPPDASTVIQDVEQTDLTFQIRGPYDGT